MISPWTVLGWLLVAIVVIGALLLPVFWWWAVRERRRWHEQFEANRVQLDQSMRPTERKRFRL